MIKRNKLIPVPRVRSQDTGRIRDVFVFLLLWHAVRLATDAAVHRAALAMLLPALVSIRFDLAYTTRSLIGLAFGIWYLKRFCYLRNISFSERFGLDRPMDPTNSTFLKALFLFLLIFTVPNVAHYLFLTWSYGVKLEGAGLTSYLLTGTRVALLSPLAEELIWRGFAYPIFKNAFCLWKGIVFTSLLFALAHLPFIARYPFPLVLLACAYFFLVGAALNILYERGANLKWCILSHALLNLILFAVDVICRELVWV